MLRQRVGRFLQRKEACDRHAEAVGIGEIGKLLL
jgi:hypothetical protein